MAENILVLEPGDERAQKIARAMSSQTANDILQQLADGPTSLTDIAERLAQPMNTVKYHVENLLEAGLISVAETKYSVKGREVKLYSLTNQLLIVAPRQSPIRSLILKYASLFCILALCTVLISALSPAFGPDILFTGSIPGAEPRFATMHDGNMERYATQAVGVAAASSNWSAGYDEMGKGIPTVNAAADIANATPGPAPVVIPQALPPVPSDLPTYAGTTGIDPAIAFFFGGVLVILILLCYEAWLWKKK
ncbi:MAG: helix-turn-helix domain-containing protein [Methanoregula sp.]|jgi:DNA-binding transcriptional ArsR family regulator|nr:helix-turn-helix domain-containing protein [Methanoregula sp.]